jgi:hypothetical protein
MRMMRTIPARMALCALFALSLMIRAPSAMAAFNCLAFGLAMYPHCRYEEVNDEKSHSEVGE